MTRRRVSSRDIPSGDLPTRVQRNGSTTRDKIADRSVGGDKLAPGAIGGREYAPRGTDERHIDPALVRRETITFHPSPGSAVVAELSDAAVVRFGGRPIVIVQLTAAFTTAGEMDLLRSGSVIDTFTLGTGATQLNLGRPFKSYSPFDEAQIEVTDAGDGGAGMLVSLWF